MTANDLLSAVLADPFDDGPRLVYADWLQENGEPERAEFIREAISRRNDGTENGWIIQPHVHHKNAAAFKIVLKDSQYLYSRGFPDEIRCTMAQWVGTDECRSCGSFSRSLGIPAIDFCLTCKGTGRTPGIAKQVCEAWPVTKVVLVGVRVAFGGHSEEYFGPYFETDDSFPWCVDRCIFDLLDGFCRTGTRGMKSPFTQKFFLSESEALDALSHAAVVDGRRLAGLPELENK